MACCGCSLERRSVTGLVGRFELIVSSDLLCYHRNRDVWKIAASYAVESLDYSLRAASGSLPIGDWTDWRFQLAFADQVAVESYANDPITLPNAFAAFGAYGSGRLLGIAPEGHYVKSRACIVRSRQRIVQPTEFDARVVCRPRTLHFMRLDEGSA